MTPQLICPHCNYDLDGLARTWETACPLSVVCSECGGEIDLNRRYRSLRNLPAWSFEHRPSVRAFMRTALMLLRPWAFWRGLTPNLGVHHRRLWAYVLLSLLLVHLCTGAIVLGALSVAGPGPAFTYPPQWGVLLWPYTSEVHFARFSIIPGLLALMNVPIAFAGIAVSPVSAAFCALPNVRARHVVRSAVMFLAFAAWLYLGVLLLVVVAGITGVAPGRLDTLVIVNVGVLFVAMIVWWRCFGTCFARRWLPGASHWGPGRRAWDCWSWPGACSCDFVGGRAIARARGRLWGG